MNGVWYLLQELAKNSTDDEVAKLAQASLDAYKYVCSVMMT